jgi:hypothetical protein
MKKILVGYLVLVFCFLFECKAEDSLIAEVNTAYHSFHSMDVFSKIHVKEKEGFLIENENQELLVKVTFSDTSRRSAVSSRVRIRYYIDENYPAVPEKWVLKYDKTLKEGDSKLVGASTTYNHEKHVRIPGNIYDFSHPVQKVKLEIDASSAAKYGWSAREHHAQRVFFVAPYPKFNGKKLPTSSVLKLSGWAHSRAMMFNVMENLFSTFLSPSYRLEQGNLPKQLMDNFLSRLKGYTDKYFDEINFKPYLAEFILSYSQGIEEQIEFPVEWDSFLSVPDKDFNLKNIAPAAKNLMFSFENTLTNNRHFVALLNVVCEQLQLFQKIQDLKGLSGNELERLAVFLDIDTRNGFLDRVNLLRKNEEDKLRSYESIGKDLKRLLGWNFQLGEWVPLERSPIFEIANNLSLQGNRREFVEASVIESVRGLLWTVFFVLASEEYYSRIMVELCNTALGIFQLAPPQVTFSLDNQILFNGDDGILIARVYNPSKYISLKNVHLLMEKNNLRRIIFYRGDNLQTVEMLKPQEVKYVFFRFSCIGIGTDVPSMSIRYNRDFETTVRVGPVSVMRKDEFLADKIQRIEQVTEKDVFNSYTRLKEKLEKFQKKLQQ